METVRYAPEQLWNHRSVLQLDGRRAFELRPTVGGPEELGWPAKPRELHTFNPSVARAPRGLCPRCSFVMTLRADALDQCTTSGGPLLNRSSRVVAANAWFTGTILAVLDRSLSLVGWTWLLTSPDKQVGGPRRQRSARASNRSDWRVPPGVSDGFAPPWGVHTFDARLLNYDGSRLFVTFLRRCHPREPCLFGAYLLQLTAAPTPDGGLTSLRAWATSSLKSTASWAQGRNQALFVHAGELLVQPWLGLVATFGVPRIEAKVVTCYSEARMPVWRRRAHTAECGPTPPHARLRLERVRESKLTRLPNSSLAFARSFSRDEEGRVRSPTSNLVRVRRPTQEAIKDARRASAGRETAGPEAVPFPPPGCEVFLGVGHVHLSDGPRNMGARARPRSRARGKVRDGAPPFQWGYDYEHFFYALSPRPPHRVVATSAPFCLPSPQASSACERVQFVSGMVVLADGEGGALAEAPGDGAPTRPAPAAGVTTGMRHLAATGPGCRSGDERLLLTYGVNDCETRLGEIAMARVWAMLRPTPPSARGDE